MELKDFTIEKVGWITKMESIPPLTQEYIHLQYLRYRILVTFLQEKGLTTRILLQAQEQINDDSEIKRSDLTDPGFEFYRIGIIPWTKAIDRNKNKEKAINNIQFLEKKYREFVMQD